MISKILNIYVMLIAILGLLVAAGFVKVSSKIQFEILKPSYVIDLRKVENNYSLRDKKDLKEFIEMLEDSVDVRFLIVDRPEWDADDIPKLKLATNGNNMFSCRFFVTDHEMLAFEMLGGQLPERWFETEPLISSEDKRIALSCAFDQITDSDIQRRKFVSQIKDSMRLTQSKVELKSDSLLKLIQGASVDLLFPLFSTRVVYNFISIDNLSNYETRNITLRIIEPYLLERKHLPSIEILAWTLPEGRGALTRKESGQVEFSLPSLGKKESIQLLVTTESSNIGRSDIHIDYNKAQNLNKGLILILLLVCLLIAIAIEIGEKKMFPHSRRKTQEMTGDLEIPPNNPEDSP